MNFISIPFKKKKDSVVDGNITKVKLTLWDLIYAGSFAMKRYTLRDESTSKNKNSSRKGPEMLP